MKKTLKTVFGKINKKNKNMLFSKYDFQKIIINKNELKRCMRNSQKEFDLFKVSVGTINSNSKSIKKPSTKIIGIKTVGLWCDFLGATVNYNGTFYKGILNERKDDFERIWEKGVIQCFAKKRMIPKIQISDYYSNDFYYLLESSYINIVPYLIWNKHMIIDSCKFVINIRRFLEQHNLTLADPHILNIAFDHGKPMYFDLGSFIHSSESKNDFSIIFGAVVSLIAKDSTTSLVSNFGFQNELFSKIGPKGYYFSPEIGFLIKKYITFHKRNSSLCLRKIIKNIFYNFKLETYYLDLLFPRYKFAKEQLIEFALLSDIRFLENKSIICFGKNNFSFLRSLIKIIKPDRTINVECSDYISANNYETQKNNSLGIETYVFNYFEEMLPAKTIQSLYSDFAILLVLENNEKLDIYKINALKTYGKKICLVINKENLVLNKQIIADFNVEIIVIE